MSYNGEYIKTLQSDQIKNSKNGYLCSRNN